MYLIAKILFTYMMYLHWSRLSAKMGDVKQVNGYAGRVRSLRRQNWPVGKHKLKFDFHGQMQRELLRIKPKQIELCLEVVAQWHAFFVLWEEGHSDNQSTARIGSIRWVSSILTISSRLWLWWSQTGFQANDINWWTSLLPLRLATASCGSLSLSCTILSEAWLSR